LAAVVGVWRTNWVKHMVRQVGCNLFFLLIGPEEDCKTMGLVNTAMP